MYIHLASRFMQLDSLDSGQLIYQYFLPCNNNSGKIDLPKRPHLNPQLNNLPYSTKILNHFHPTE